jgi:hypothetical protein
MAYSRKCTLFTSTPTLVQSIRPSTHIPPVRDAAANAPRCRFGTISFAVKGANIPGAAGDIDTSTVGKRSRIHANRGIFSFVGDAIGCSFSPDTFRLLAFPADFYLCIPSHQKSQQFECQPVKNSSPIRRRPDVQAFLAAALLSPNHCLRRGQCERQSSCCCYYRSSSQRDRDPTPNN